MLNITNRKRYETDKRSMYLTLHEYLENDGFAASDCRFAEFVFVKAKLNCLLGNFETASEVT